MRTVDFRTFPDRSELRSQLIDAFDEIDLDDGEQTEPIADDAAVGVGYPAELTDAELRERANEVRTQVEALLDDGVKVRFALDDGEAEDDEGSPDHLD